MGLVVEAGGSGGWSCHRSKKGSAKLILLQTGLEQGLFSHEKTQEEEASPCPQPSAFRVSLQAPCRCSQYLLGQLPGVAVGKEETNVFPLGF